MTERINKSQLDRIEGALIGNGREGLLARTARIEERLEATAESTNAAKDAADLAARKADEASMRALNSANALAVNVEKMNDLLVKHVEMAHLASMMKKKSFWVSIFMGFVILHLVSTYMPNLWDAVMIFLGIPKLIIPIV